jgi:5-methylcytosine-specific restriction endonuclease McrA
MFKRIYNRLFYIDKNPNKHPPSILTEMPQPILEELPEEKRREKKSKEGENIPLKKTGPKKKVKSFLIRITDYFIHLIWGREKQRSIPKDIRNSVWLKYHGSKNEGVCYCCGSSIDNKHGWHCSHVLSRNKGGKDTVENLRTCCQHCNLSMGNCNLYVYIKKRNLKGPGSSAMDEYLTKNKSQVHDKRTNNWGKKRKATQ